MDAHVVLLVRERGWPVLSSDAALPGAQDAETLMPPVARYWFRRVPGHNLWIYFAFDDVQLIVITISPRPPVPLTD